MSRAHRHPLSVRAAGETCAQRCRPQRRGGNPARCSRANVPPAPQRSPRLPPRAPRPGCLRPPTASEDPSKHASPWLPPRFALRGAPPRRPKSPHKSTLLIPTPPAAGHRRVAFPAILAPPRCRASRPPRPNPLTAPGLRDGPVLKQYRQKPPTWPPGAFLISLACSGAHGSRR